MKGKLALTSLYTITGLYGFLVALLAIIFTVLKLPLSSLILWSIVILILQFLLAPFFTDIMMKYLYKADFKREMPEYLKVFSDSICSSNSMKNPRFAVIPDSAPNAFTYGRTKNDARIVFTEGMFELLSEDEVKAVYAHEMGHVVHYDMALMTVAQLVPLVLYYVYLSTRNLGGKGDSKAKDIAQYVSIIAYLGYVFSQYVVLWFSRVREYYADEFSVLVTKNPNALSLALVKVGFGLVSKNNTGESKKATSLSSLGISDAKQKSVTITMGNGEIDPHMINAAGRWELFNWWAKLNEIHSTHPLITKRIKAISASCLEFDQSPLVNFDNEAPADFKNEFFKEFSLLMLPSAALISLITLGVYLEMPVLMTFSLVIFTSLNLIYFSRKYNKGEREYRTVSSLLSEYNVSKVTAIPCTLKGTLIGRGNPGYIFSEDFVLRDETGIIFLDYKQPLGILNFFFGAFSAKKYIGKDVIIKGWYRRDSIPHVQMESFEVDGVLKKQYEYQVAKFINYFLLATGIVLSVLVLL